MLFVRRGGQRKSFSIACKGQAPQASIDQARSIYCDGNTSSCPCQPGSGANIPIIFSAARRSRGVGIHIMLLIYEGLSAAARTVSARISSGGAIGRVACAAGRVRILLLTCLGFGDVREFFDLVGVVEKFVAARVAAPVRGKI